MARLIVKTNELLELIEQFEGETDEIIIEINETENTVEIEGYEAGGLIMSDLDPIKGKKLELEEIAFFMG